MLSPLEPQGLMLRMGIRSAQLLGLLSRLNLAKIYDVSTVPGGGDGFVALTT